MTDGASDPSSGAAGSAAVGESRASAGLVVLYAFREGAGVIVSDQADTDDPLNLVIEGDVIWLKDRNGVQVTDGRIGSTGSANKIIDALQRTNACTFEMWLAPANLSQGGPARMLSVGVDGSAQNFVLGQEGRNLHVRLRHTAKDERSRPRLITTDELLTTDLTHVVHTYDGSTERLYVNGSQHQETIEATGTFSNWDAAARFNIANEGSSDRPWAGAIRMVAVYDRALSPSEVLRHFRASPDFSGSDCLDTADCDDGLFCNGAEACKNGFCASETDPCPGQLCDESSRTCSICSSNADCDDGKFCNGTETCADDACFAGPQPCTGSQVCDEDQERCITPQANVYFVDDDGDQQPEFDSAAPAGSRNNPFDSLQTAADAAEPGDVVFIRRGTYTAPNDSHSTPVLRITTSGLAGAPIRFQNYQDEIVLIDAESRPSSVDMGHRRGIEIGPGMGHIEIAGLLVKNAFREGIAVFGDHILIEDCIAEDCGLNTTDAESAGIKFDGSKFLTVRRCVTRHCYNGMGARHAEDALIEDCLSYRSGVTSNGDTIFPENANGFQTGVARAGSDRVRFVRCVAWGNADDGWDLSHSRDCIVEGCIAFLQNDLLLPDGDGGGYKVGNDQNETDPLMRMRRVLVRYCIAFRNRGSGIDPRDGIDGFFYNNTAYGNLGQFGFSTGQKGHAASFYNNLSWGNVQSDLFVGDASKTSDFNNWADATGRQVPGGDFNSIRRNPGFADPDATIDTSWQGGFDLDDVRGIMPTINHIRDQVRRNFALSHTGALSTSIDRGTFITFAGTAGFDTTQVEVTDDPRTRFRIGDEIQIEGATLARIIDITATTLTLDEPLSFSAGAGVHLRYAGARPDIGAVESP